MRSTLVSALVLFFASSTISVFGAPVPVIDLAARADPVDALEIARSLPSAVEGQAPELDPRGKTYSGRGTWYYPGLGACGHTNSNSDYVVAVNSAQYAGSCGKSLVISSGGKTVHAKAVDECPGCGWGSLDMSPAVFKALKPLSVGVVSIKWHYA